MKEKIKFRNKQERKQAIKAKSLTTIFLVILLAGLSACNSKDKESVADNLQSDNLSQSEEIILYKNGSIYTVNKNQPWAEALVIKDGIIRFVGSSNDAIKFEEKAKKVVDLKGKMILPGLHDVHIHPLESGSNNTHFELSPLESNAENFIPTIRKAARDYPGQNWLIGYGHDLYTLLDSQRSPLDILDQAVPNRPVIIMEQTSHSMWVNSKALEVIGFSKATADPVGGVIMKNDSNGEPNGILIDNAGNLAMDIAMAPTEETLQNDYKGLVHYTLPALAQVGITSIADARAYWKRKHHETWKKVEQDGYLTARVVLGLWAYPEHDDEVQINMFKSLLSNDKDKLLKINQIKLYSDGIPSNTTAALHTPYLVDFLDIPGNLGLNYFSEQRIEKYIRALEPSGFDFHIHAIGERGIFESLNAIQRASQGKGRHRLTHVEIVDPNDYSRFAELNVTVDAQVAGNFTHPENWNEYSELIGDTKSDNIVPLRDLKDAGARITLSSDWSVSPFNPFIGMQNAVTRFPQNLTLSEAIEAYTLSSAYVLRQENSVGSIEVGKKADLIVIDQNLFEINPDSIGKTKVLQTLLDGREIYRSSDF
ncbi:amidohydrolase [Aliikangiella sp. G2MR2-5]|uniref:amidohydrolase n=1 Tax=Aliikangiella sp. G2MR2-5 TaxID=2788943 RepID=UPI0018AA57CC|nr:amidohydrolase [Aliikangiella sp. G2MR2-5]